MTKSEAKEILVNIGMTVLTMFVMYVVVSSTWISYSNPEMTQTQVFYYVIGLGD